MSRLTKRAVDAAKPNGRDYFIWDGDLPGFGARVFTSGRKTYVLQYRALTRTRRYTIGLHGPLTPEAARTKAMALLADIAHGADPSKAKRSAMRGSTMADLCDLFLKQHVAVHNRPSTEKEVRRLIEARIKPRLRMLKISGVSREDIIGLHHSLRETPRQANLTIAVLSKMFNFAEAMGLRAAASNPCRLVRKYAEVKRERFLSDEELARLGQALDAAEQTGTEQAVVLTAIRLLALSGCRLGEIVTLRWQDVDLQRGLLKLPQAKAGARDHAIGGPRSSFAGWPRPRLRMGIPPIGWLGAYQPVHAGEGLGPLAQSLRPD